MSAVQLLTEHLAIWSSADTAKKFGRGRASGSAASVYGVKKLRELILELAVRGKLVPQDANDEPASELLKRIQVEKAKLIAEGKIKKSKPLAAIEDDEQPFEVPKSWEWVRVGQVLKVSSGGSFDLTAELNSGLYIYLKVGDMNLPENEIVITSSSRFVNPTEKELQGVIPQNSIIFPKRGGAIATNKKRLVLSEIFVDLNIMAITVPKLILLSYIFQWLSGIDLAKLNTGTSVPQINHKDIDPLCFPLPPLAEQHRIVAKVDELMALCDQLENQHTDAIAAHEKLVSYLLDALTQSKDAADFNENWQRIAANFEMLFTTESSIDALKQTLLQLAVMGKLVPQDASDEPASKLLKRIQAEKARLVAEGKIKKSKPLPEIKDEEKPFGLPQGWEWARLGYITKVLSGNAFKSEDFNNVTGTKVIKITNAGVCKFIESPDFLPANFLAQYPEFIVLQGDLILALTRPYISTGLKISICPASYNNSLLNQRVASIKAGGYLESEYVFLYLKSPFILKLYQNRFGNSGLQPNLKISDVTELLIATPPRSEQIRIVAKVDELIAICDTLKSRITAANQLQQKMADVMVAQAVVQA